MATSGLLYGPFRHRADCAVELLGEVADDREAFLEMRLGDVVDVALREVLDAERLGGGWGPLGAGRWLGRRGCARCEEQREGQDAGRA
jgi:hypothetical protein